MMNPLRMFNAGPAPTEAHTALVLLGFLALVLFQGFALWKGGDEAVIDGTAVNGSARVVAVFAAITRRLQTGFLYHYALAMILGLFVLLTWFSSPLSAWLGK